LLSPSKRAEVELCTRLSLEWSRAKVALKVGEARSLTLRESRQLIGGKEVPVPLLPRGGEPLIALDAHLRKSKERAICHQKSNHFLIGGHLGVTAEEECAEREWTKLHFTHQKTLAATEEQDINLVKRGAVRAVTQWR